MYDRTTVRPYKVLLLTCVVNSAAGTPTPRLCPVVSALGSKLDDPGSSPVRRKALNPWDVRGKKKRAPLLGLVKSIYYTVNYRYGTLEEKFHINAHPYITLYFQHCT